MSNHKLKLIGRTFRKLTVIREIAERDKFCNVFWECKCQCGKSIIVKGYYLKRESVRSCGCDDEKESHGMSNTKLYSVWHSMKIRCYLKTDPPYNDYGGRGISVCERWIHSFNNFMQDMGNEYKEGLQLDRIDNDANYEKSNCRWATHSQNNRNKRSNRFLTLNNKTQTVADWSDETGLKHCIITRRLKRGWTVEKTLTTQRQENYPLHLK